MGATLIIKVAPVNHVSYLIEIGVCHWTSFSCIRSFINKQLSTFHLNYSVDDKHT